MEIAAPDEVTNKYNILISISRNRIGRDLFYFQFIP